jgi:beta-phosphoglucomutase-like phosphatase (HAD superfamily)
MRIEPVFLFDLDGTLVDSVYQHVLAWKEALDAEEIERTAKPSRPIKPTNSQCQSNQCPDPIGVRRQRHV